MTGDKSGIGDLVWFLFLICLVGGGIGQSLLRHRAIRRMAQTLGFTYVGDTLPSYLELEGTHPAGAAGYSNVIDGKVNGIVVVAFDYRRGTGKSTIRRTAIAAMSDHDPFDPVPFSRGMTTERSGRWIMLYEPTVFGWTGLIPVSELEARLLAIS